MKATILVLLLAFAVPLHAQNFQQKLTDARTAAKAGHADEAFAALGQLAAWGFGNVDLLNADDAFLGIRSDARWATTLEAVKKNAHPCWNRPEYRQFDYWLGEWDVEARGQKVATSSIQLALDQCVVFENYHTFRGYEGKSFSIFDASKKRWEQRYVDTTGASHEWIGGLEGDHMRFLWHHDDADGKPVVERMTYLKEGPDKVRQVIETSSDDGKTWTTSFDGLYTRRK